MTSYEMLPPAMRDELDTLLSTARGDMRYPPLMPHQEAYLREAIANLILTCLLLDKQPPESAGAQ